MDFQKIVPAHKRRPIMQFAVVLLVLALASGQAFGAANGSSEGVTAQSDNDCAGANLLALGMFYFAYIDGSGDVDWHKWNIPYAGKFTATLDVPSSRDYDLEVYRDCNTLICTSNKEKGIDEACAVNANYGTIYAKIYGYNNDFSPSEKYYIKGDLTMRDYDLIVTSIETEPASIDEKTTFKLRISIKNTGTEDIDGVFKTDVYVNGAKWSDCTHSQGAKAGELRVCTWENLKWGVGSYTIKAVTDSENKIGEKNEANNERTKSLDVSPYIPKYDLTPTSLIADPPSPTDLDSITVNFGVANLGPDDITTTVSAKLFIDDAFKGECSKSSLNSGYQFTCDRTSLKLSSGTHELKDSVDPANLVAETDENNNVITQNLNVKHVPNYDLTIEDIQTFPGGELNDKMKLNANAWVKNAGTDDITSQFKVLISVDDLSTHTCTVNGLNAGISAVCSFEDQQWAAGKHTVYAYADIPDKQIQETNEDNNQMQKDFTVTHVFDYDLTITNIYTIPASADSKTTFELRAETKNTGTESVTSPFKTQVYVDGEAKGPCSHDSGIAAGTTLTCQIKSQKWAAGSHTVKATADSENAIKETSEDNNNMEKTVEVKQYCPIPDGSADDCDCNSDTDCPSGYYCEFGPGNDACVELAECNGDCATAGYSCSQGDAYECGSFDADPCLDKKLKQVCNLFGQKCDAAKGGCEAVSEPVKLRMEDAPSHSIIVYKQPGDLVEVTVTSEKPQNADFSYPENFTLKSGICAGKTALGVGETTCLFEISETTASGEYFFTANEKLARVVVISKPKSVIITNRQKLSERFQSDKAGVKALLEQAFQFAHNERDMVIYYLDREVEGHPFQSYGSYGESILSPEMTDNAYSMNTAELIAEKCGDCGNVIVLGDDFIVPFYRADYALIHNWWKWWAENKSETHYLYSDQPYIKEKKKTMGDMASLFDKSQHEQVKIVVPDTISPDIQSWIDKIKEAVKAFSYSDSDIKQLKSGSIGCNSYNALDEATLILIGTREDNNAIKCVPWFDVGSKPTDTFKASIEIERNVWANNEYAIIVSGKDIHSGMENLYAMMSNPDYFRGTALGQRDTVYIHDFSNPPPMPPGLSDTAGHVVGFVLGTCEEGKLAGEKGACIATDMIAGVVPPTDVITDIRDVVLYCPSFIWNKITGKKGELLNGLACGGSAAGTGITIGKYVTAVTGVGAVVGTAADGGSTALKTVLKVTKSALKGESDRLINVLDKIQLFKFDNAWTFFKASGKDSLFSGVQKFVKVTSESSFHVNKMTAFFPEDALAATIKSVDDYEDMTKGTQSVMKSFAGGLEEFAPELKKCITAVAVTATEICDIETAHKIAVAVAEKVNTIGKVYDKIAAKYGQDIAKITVKGIKENVIDPKNADLPEKLARYAKGLAKDPMDAALGEEQLLKVLKSSGKMTRGGTENIKDVLVLKKGNGDAFGLEHIKKHLEDFQTYFGVSGDKAIMDIIKDAVDGGKKGISNKPGINEVIEKEVTYNGKTSKVRVVFDITETNKGSIVTAFPFE